MIIIFVHVIVVSRHLKEKYSYLIMIKKYSQLSIVWSSYEP